jgi:putative endonuclease
LVFVEVKAREDLRYGDGAEAITALKRRRMARVALDYLARHQVTECPCRFDVVSIHFDAGQPVVEVFQNAFDVTEWGA